VKIGLTYTGSPEKHQYYIDWLKGHDNIEIIRLSADDNNLSEIENLDALVLSGGRDMHPKYYGKTKVDYNESPGSFDEKRDEFEMNAFKLAQENHLPVLGICRGLQLINCALGGDLKQDLGALDTTHQGNPDKQHATNIETGTLLHDVVGKESGDINSAHHQAIDHVGKDLRVNARATDGTIEGIEWNDRSGKPFMLAVQWHPERMFRFNLQDSVLSKNIRNRFIEEVRKSISAIRKNK